MPSHTLEELLARQQGLLQQQQSLQSQGPEQLNLGLLNNQQQSIGDALSNPDAAQVGGVLGLIAGLVNPQGDAPVGTAAVNALTNFGSLRQQDQKARQQQLRQRGQNIKDQLKSLSDIGRTQVDIEGLSIRRDAEQRKQKRFEQIDKPGEARAAQSFGFAKGTEVYINPQDGRTVSLVRGNDNLLRLPGSEEVIDPVREGFVPSSDKLVLDTQERLRENTQTSEKRKDTFELFNKITNSEAFPRVAGSSFERLVRFGISTVGLGEEQEVVLKNIRQASIGGVLEEIKALGAKPTDADRDFVAQDFPDEGDDEEVFFDYIANRLVTGTYRAVKRDVGQQAADEWLSSQVQFMNADTINAAVKGSPLAKFKGVTAPPPVLSSDGALPSGRRWRRIN